MGGRTFVLIVVSALLALAPAVAAADTAAQVEKANAFALENLDLGDHEAARDSLAASVTRLDKAGLAGSPLAAQTRALLGLTHVLLGDEAAAAEQFAAAVRIVPDVALDARYATEGAQALLDKARSAMVAENTVDCSALIGILHERVEKADAASPITIKAHAGAELRGALVLSYSAVDGGFAEVPLTKKSGCEYIGEIPADAVRAGTIEYFVVAKNKAGKLLASKGTAASPYLIAVAAPADPGGSEATTEGGEAVEDEIPDAIQAPKGPRKGGCAGCVAARGNFDGAGALLLLGAVLVLRRRRG